MAKHNCAECKFRAKYDKNPVSLLGRIWRWHASWCPGWKAYVSGLSEEEQLAMAAKYNMPQAFLD